MKIDRRRQFGPDWAFLVTYAYSDDAGWNCESGWYFRIFGYGIACRRTPGFLSFGERFGLKWYWRIGSYVINILWRGQ